MKRFLLITVCFLCSLCAFAQNSAGIGASVIKDGQNCFVLYVIPDSPAANSGLREGIEISKIDGKDTRRLDVNNIASRLKGPKDSKVTLHIVQSGTTKKVEITRDIIYAEGQDILSNPEFMHYWKQIAPARFSSVVYLKKNDRFSRNIMNYIYLNNYWVDRRSGFEKDFLECKAKYGDEDSSCVTSLVAQEKNKTQQDVSKVNLQFELQNQQIHYNRQAPAQNVQLIKDAGTESGDGTFYLINTNTRPKGSINYNL